MKAGGLGPYNLIRPTISLEMPVPSQGHYGFPRFPVIDRFCLFMYLRNNNTVFEELELSIVDFTGNAIMSFSFLFKYCSVILLLPLYTESDYPI